MGTIFTNDTVIQTNTLLIKHGRGNSVGIWKDSSTRFGYFKIPKIMNWK